VYLYQLPSFVKLLCLVLARGVCGGTFLTLMPVVMVHQVGREEFPRTFGIAQIVNGLSMAVGHVMMGM
jgi:hypothetical protein